MKLKLILLALVLATSAGATTIPIDLGPPRLLRGSNELNTNLTQFNGPMDGQHLTLDFRFNNFVRILRVTQPSSFNVFFGLRFDTNVRYTGVAPDWGPMMATLLDQAGQPLSPLESIFTSPSSTGPVIIDRFGNLPFAGGFFVNRSDVIAPYDIYGVRFDLTIPLDLGHEVLGGNFRFTTASNLIQIGDLPETGSALLLFVLGCGAIWFLQNVWLEKRTANN